MRIRYTLCLLSLAASSALAATDLLPIDHGTWVRDGYACDDAPLAASFTYDGQAPHGAHASRCDAAVVAQDGSTYELSSTCRGEGDGTPSRPFTEIERFTVASPTRLTFAHQQDRADYRWCGS